MVALRVDEKTRRHVDETTRRCGGALIVSLPPHSVLLAVPHLTSPTHPPTTNRNNAKRKKGGENGTRTKRARAHANGHYVCDYCQKDLSTSLRVKCNECQDFDLCLECFAVGVELNPHKNTHAYRIVDDLSMPVYTMDWGIDEEMLLLEGIERYGLHWKQVANHVGRPAEDCKDHYFGVYIDTESFPKPCKAEMASMTAEEINQMMEEKRVACARKMALMKSGIKLPVVKEEEEWEGESSRGGTPSVTAGLAGAAGVTAKTATTDPTAADDDMKIEPKFDATTTKKPRKLTKTAMAKLAKQKAKEEAAAAGGVGGVGEMGLEGREAQAQAQTGNKTLAGAGGGVTEGAPVAMAESQQSGYHIKRNEFETEYDHEAEHLIADLEFGEDDTPEEVQEKLRLIEIYNKRLDEREKRRNFVLSRGLVKVKRQQLIDRRRTPAEKDIVGRLRVLARYMPHPQWEALADGLTVEARLRSRIQELKEYRSLGMRTFEEVDAFIEAGGIKKKESSINNQPGRSKLQRILVDSHVLERELRGMGADLAADMVRDSVASVPEGKGVNGLQLWRAKRGVTLDVTSLPDSEPLNMEERRLCCNERYLPAQYLSIKDDVLRIQQTQGYVTKQDIIALPYSVDYERALRLYAWFVEREWIKPK